MTPGPGEAAALAIERFAPRSVSGRAARFARTVTTGAGPVGLHRAKAFLFAASKLASFAEQVGLELDPAVLLSPAVIERCCTEGAMTRATARTVRANLRAVASALGPPAAVPSPLPRGRAKPPYRAAEMARYLALADAQPTPLRRARANALICLSAGAGLVGQELRHVRGDDVVVRSGGVLVVVGGPRARAVPVLAPSHDRLLHAASFFGSAYLVSGRNPDGHNVTNPLIRSLSGGADLPRLDPGRLRSTYLAAMAETIGLRAFMDAAGVSCTQRLGDLVAQLDAAPEPVAVALLGAGR